MNSRHDLMKAAFSGVFDQLEVESGGEMADGGEV